MRVALTGVSVVFGGRTVLESLNLAVDQGEVVAIMGPSGSGKSTLLSVVAGRQPLHAGAVESSVGRRDIDWLVQSTPLLTRRTAVANAALGALAVGDSVGASRARARDALGQVGLATLTDQKVARLSGGERQRVAIARAMVRESPVVLADEPTASLDGHSRRLVCEALLTLARQGAAVIIATHDPVVASFAHRTMSLETGKLNPFGGGS